jgi:hypothetical protein
MVRETWRWLMVPTEEMVRGKLTLRWEAVSVSASAPSLVEEIENKLKEEEWLVSAWSPVHLNRVLEQWYFKDGSDRGVGIEGVARQLPVSLPAAPAEFRRVRAGGDGRLQPCAKALPLPAGATGRVCWVLRLGSRRW